MLHNDAIAGRSLVLVGLMGAGKTAVGKRLAARLGMPFFDADAEIEQAAGITVAEIFERHGEAHFRAGEKRVIERLLGGGPIVLAPGGGAFMDAETRGVIKERAVSIWLNCPVEVLVGRVKGRTHRPLLNGVDQAEVLRKLAAVRHPFYAEADIVVYGNEDSADVTTERVLQAVEGFAPARRVRVEVSAGAYEVVIGGGLLAKAGALIAGVLREKRCVVVTDDIVAGLHLGALERALGDGGVAFEVIVVPAGEASKSLEVWAGVVDGLLEKRVERHTAVVALGGGVIGDLAGFAAAATLRGLPFVQVPTTLLAQVDSSVGGKTGINARWGKNLVGAFHQPRIVVADLEVLATLPARELRAGYAEIVKAGLIGDATFYEWCEVNGGAMMAGDVGLLAEAVERAVRFKAAVVGNDEREEKPNDGRALLNLGHTFAHALEKETGYGGGLLHGEAVAVGLVLATALSARMGFCGQEDAGRVAAHLGGVGLPVRVDGLGVDSLLRHMKQDKKMRGGTLHFVLTRGIGKAFTCGDVEEELVREVLLGNGAV